MFGFGKKKIKKSKTDKRGKKKSKELQASCTGGSQKGKSESQRIREEALANARAAREHIGEETVQRIAELMAKKENNPFQQAIKKLEKADSDRVADEILYMLDDK